MKCPVCFASQVSYENELIHVCPYCDAILIPDENRYKIVDIFPWWVPKQHDEKVNGILISDKHKFLFYYKDNSWIVNNKYIFYEIVNEKYEYNEYVKYIHGSMPVFTYPGLKITVVEDDQLKIYHQKGLTIFNRI